MIYVFGNTLSRREVLGRVGPLRFNFDEIVRKCLQFSRRAAHHSCKVVYCLPFPRVDNYEEDIEDLFQSLINANLFTVKSSTFPIQDPETLLKPDGIHFRSNVVKNLIMPFIELGFKAWTEAIERNELPRMFANLQI